VQFPIKALLTLFSIIVTVSPMLQKTEEVAIPVALKRHLCECSRVSSWGTQFFCFVLWCWELNQGPCACIQVLYH
jgi:hypothetical protein